MSIGQIAEIVAMLSLGVCLKRIGLKAVLIIGIVAQVWRFAAFTIAGSLPVIASGIACHGVNYAFFIVAAIIFVDSRCEKHSRTGVHQLFIIINGGFGGFAGNFVAGRAMDFFAADGGAINFRGFWTVPLVMTLICLVITMIFVPRDGGGAEVTAELDEV
jgi:MFS family permease